ncbi:MAG TPA: ChbG/HpnK family deacetylase [Syntrophales bacterium]|nr:ChbG/HpnK family deacetylase [Syntrophales bacterium]
MKRLIINADDLGADEARNEGIFEAIREGLVTSASILPNGPALEHALGTIRSGGFEQVSFGVHLNLSEGRPLARDLSRLTGPDGNFLGKAEAHRLLMKAGDAPLQGDIARESALQIERLLDASIGITHIDGHQHIHVFPAALRNVADAAKGRGIRRMRIPDETVAPGCDDVRPDLLQEARRFAALGKAARKALAGTGIVSSDHFRGLALKGRLDLEGLLKLIETLPEGTTELMVHPGRVPAKDAFSAFSSRERERELGALLDPRFRLALDRAGVVLISFGEIDS